MGLDGIRMAYATGKGAITMRAQAHIEDLRGGHSAIIITGRGTRRCYRGCHWPPLQKD